MQGPHNLPKRGQEIPTWYAVVPAASAPALAVSAPCLAADAAVSLRRGVREIYFRTAREQDVFSGKAVVSEKELGLGAIRKERWGVVQGSAAPCV